MAVSKQQSIEWISNLRFLALIAVITLHCSAVLLAEYGKVPLADWFAADIFNALVRFAVPVFVMITGTLLLHRDYELGDFLKKRLGRIIIPFLFWSLVYVAYAWYIETIDFDHDWWTNTKQVLHQLKYSSSYHLWYVYMLIGLYLSIPIIGRFVRSAGEKEILYFLSVWLVVMLLSQPYISRFKPVVELRYFEGYPGYLVLGHYLAFKDFSSRRLRLWMLLLFICTAAVITTGTYFLAKTGSLYGTLFYEPLGPFSVCLSASLFLYVRLGTPTMPGWIAKTRDFAGKYAFGIYLCHALLLYLLDDWGISYKLCTPFLSIPLTAIVCLILSVLLTWLLNKIPVIGQYVG